MRGSTNVLDRDRERQLEILAEFRAAAELGDVGRVHTARGGLFDTGRARVVVGAAELRCVECGARRAANRARCPECLSNAAERQRAFGLRARARRDRFLRDNAIVRDCGVWTVRR